MASLKGLSNQGQTVVMCELCETESRLKWWCLQCRLRMCHRCREKVHPKFPSAKDHTIIDIKDISHHEEEHKLDFTELKCTEHKQKCCLFCKPCGMLVCPTCVAKTHSKHKMTEIHEGYEIQVNKIKNRQREIKKEMKNVSKTQEEYKNIKREERSTYTESKQGILNYKKSLMDPIEKHCNELAGELDHKWNTISQSIEIADQELEETQRTLLLQNDEVNAILQSNDVTKVFLFGSLPTSNGLNTELAQATFDHVPKFIPGDLSKLTFVRGRIQDTISPYNKTFRLNSARLSVIKKVTTNYIRINNIIPCPDGSLWINDETSKVVQRVKEVQSSIEVLSEFHIHVSDMALSSTGDILLRFARSSIIKVLQSGEMTDSPYGVSPLRPLGIHVTRDNKMIIGVTPKGTAFPSTKSGQVIILDHSGRKEKIFKYNNSLNDRTPLFTFPSRVTSTKNNKIGVLDVSSADGEGSFVILKRDGSVINIYTGHPDVNPDGNTFKPFSIATTPSDNFIITEPGNHTLHILSGIGEILTYHNTNDLGIKLPFSLSFSQAGYLYIGCGTYENSTSNANIYKIDKCDW